MSSHACSELIALIFFMSSPNTQGKFDWRSLQISSWRKESISHLLSHVKKDRRILSIYSLLTFNPLLTEMKESKTRWSLKRTLGISLSRRLKMMKTEVLWRKIFLFLVLLSLITRPPLASVFDFLFLSRTSRIKILYVCPFSFAPHFCNDASLSFDSSGGKFYLAISSLLR